MYKALYRKYRPDSFDSVVGQQAIIKTLQNIVKEDRISHAYLFSGPRGTGKTSVAKIFAKAINCINPIDGMPCGECSICKQIKEDKISDIIEIDAASNNGVDEIRDLKSKINLVPTVCKYKVYIIDEVHMLSAGAFNALLKTLEEPPHHVVFILATTEIHKLPLTIISRCQNFNFKKITEEQMKLRLSYIVDMEKIKITDDALCGITKVTDGGMRDAIGLLEQLCSFTVNNITLNDVELLSSTISINDTASVIIKIINNDISGVFNDLDRFYQDGKDFIKIAEDMIVFLKDILLYRKAKTYFNSHTSLDLQKYEQSLSELTDNKLYDYIKEVNSSLADLRTSNHPKIMFEVLLLKLMGEGTSHSRTASENSDNAISNSPELNDTLINTPLLEVSKSETELIEQKTETTIIQETCVETSSIDILPFVKIPDYKKILINNTLALAEKGILLDIKKKCSQLSTFLINKDYKQAATILMDGKVVGACNKAIIYTYPYTGMVEKADSMLSEIEALLNHVTNSKLKIVNIDDEVWKDVRPYYVSLMKEKKAIDILPWSDDIMPSRREKGKKKSKEIEEAINMFGEDLIEIK